MKPTAYLSVPFYSQYKDVVSEEWQHRSCAITCLKMVMDFLSGNATAVSTEDLINEGIEIGAYQENVGWIHAGLARLARNHGFLCYNEEFRSRGVLHQEVFIDRAITKIKKKLENNLPVIVSCSKNWDEVHKFHQVVLVGFDDNGFYYHEPEAKSEAEGSYRYVHFDIFRLHWRKFAIFVSI